MSRNKALLLILLIAAIFFLLPDTPEGRYAKELMIRLASYLLVVILVYLIITINVLKRAFRRVFDEANDENTLRAAKMLRITFDVKRCFGAGTLKAVYAHANESRNVGLPAKTALYEAIRRKRVEIPLPMEPEETAANPAGGQKSRTAGRHSAGRPKRKHKKKG